MTFPQEPLVDWSAGTPYTIPFGRDKFPMVALCFLFLGFVVSSYFLVYEVKATPASRSLVKELSMATVASLLYGYGGLYFMQSCGIYV